MNSTSTFTAASAVLHSQNELCAVHKMDQHISSKNK